MPDHSALSQPSRDLIAAAELDARSIYDAYRRDAAQLKRQAFDLGIDPSGIGFSPGDIPMSLVDATLEEGAQQAAAHLFRVTVDQYWIRWNPDIEAFLADVDSLWRSAHQEFGINTQLPADLKMNIRARALRARATSHSVASEEATGNAPPERPKNKMPGNVPMPVQGAHTLNGAMRANSTFWRLLRTEFESLQGHEFKLMWNTRLQPGLIGNTPGESHWAWVRFPDESLKARLSAMALRGARGLGYDSEDDWYDELRTSDFVRFRFSGSTQYREAGELVEAEFGPINDVVKESITLCYRLEVAADGQVSRHAGDPDVTQSMHNPARGQPAANKQPGDGKRPEICFERWGPIPDDHPLDLRAGQSGFYLANDGTAAHEISVESFAIGPSIQVKSETLPRIEGNGKRFMLVWLDGFPSSPKWDLLSSLANASQQNPATVVAQGDYHVRVSIKYRDSRNTWYRSSADLIYIPSQRKLQFGATVHDGVEPESDALSDARKESPRFRGSRQCDPSLWRYFDYEKTSKTSPYRESLANNFVSLSISARSSNRDVAEQVAKAANIPIGALPNELDRPVFPRGQVVFAFAGDQFDEIAQGYENMLWWVSDAGLNMAVATPTVPGRRVSTLDELLGKRSSEAPVETRKPSRPGKTDATVQRIKRRVRELKKEGLDYRSICERLGSFDRPPRAIWRELIWPTAYKKHTSAVTKWLSESCSGPRS